MEKLLSLPTFFAAAKKVGAAPHRGNANRPTRKQDFTTPKAKPKLKPIKAQDTA
jgi:general secretion pathway protein K